MNKDDKMYIPSFLVSVLKDLCPGQAELVCTKLLHYSICSKVPHKFVLSAKPSIKLNLLFRRQFLSTENVGTFDN